MAARKQRPCRRRPSSVFPRISPGVRRWIATNWRRRCARAEVGTAAFEPAVDGMESSTAGPGRVGCLRGQGSRVAVPACGHAFGDDGRRLPRLARTASAERPAGRGTSSHGTFWPSTPPLPRVSRSSSSGKSTTVYPGGHSSLAILSTPSPSGARCSSGRHRARATACACGVTDRDRAALSQLKGAARGR